MIHLCGLSEILVFKCPADYFVVLFSTIESGFTWFGLCTLYVCGNAYLYTQARASESLYLVLATVNSSFHSTNEQTPVKLIPGSGAEISLSRVHSVTLLMWCRMHIEKLCWWVVFCTFVDSDVRGRVLEWASLGKIYARFRLPCTSNGHDSTNSCHSHRQVMQKCHIILQTTKTYF